MMDKDIKHYFSDALTEEKGKTATTIGPHGKSKLTRKQRKALKDTQSKEQENKKEESETTQEKPAENKNDEEKEEVNQEDNLDDADLDKELIQAAAQNIVKDRVALYNNQLEALYRIAGNFLSCKNPSFPIFDVSLLNKEQEQKESKKEEKTEFVHNLESKLFETVSLFEKEEKERQEKSEPKAKRYQLSYSKTWPSNKTTSKISKLAKTLKIQDIEKYSNIGRLCVVVAKLVEKYTDLYSNIKEVNGKINIGDIILETQNSSLSLNNSLLKRLFDVFGKTEGAIGIKLLNVFTVKSIQKITSANKFDSLIKILPYELTEELGKKVSQNADFQIELEENSEAYKYFSNDNFRRVWFNIKNDNEGKQNGQ